VSWAHGSNRAFAIAWGAGWAFAISFALYAYYEDGPAAVAAAVAVRLVPAALAAPYARRLAGRIPFSHTLIARAALLGITALAVQADLSFPLVLLLVAAVKTAGAADRWYFAAATDPGFDGSPQAMRATDTARRNLDEASLLGGAVAAGLMMLVLPLDTVFALCALACGAAAMPLTRLRTVATTGPRLTLASREPRRLHLVRAARGAARAAIELLVVVLAIELLGMEDSGVGWLTGALALGLIVGARTLPPPPVTMALGAAIALAAVPVALLALEPPPLIALALLTLLGIGFALCRRAERTLEDHCPAAAHIDGEELVDALARVAGATAAAAFTLALGDDTALVAAAALVALLGLGVASALEPAPAVEASAEATVAPLA
jgi:hypothetical protein